MAGSHWSGPGFFGPNKDPGDPNAPYNQGTPTLTQQFLLSFNATLTTEVEFWVPPGCQLQDFLIDVLTAFNSATSATLTVGSASGGTQYVSGVDVKASTGRKTPTYTAAQLAAMAGLTVLGVAAPIAGPVFVDITSVGQPTAGVVQFAARYIQL